MPLYVQTAYLHAQEVMKYNYSRRPANYFRFDLHLQDRERKSKSNGKQQTAKTHLKYHPPFPQPKTKRYARIQDRCFKNKKLGERYFNTYYIKSKEGTPWAYARVTNKTLLIHKHRFEILPYDMGSWWNDFLSINFTEILAVFARRPRTTAVYFEKLQHKDLVWGLVCS